MIGNRKADDWIALDELVKIILGIIAVIAIIGGCVLLYKTLYPGPQLSQPEYTFMMIREEINDLNPGDKFSIATLGRTEFLTAYSGDAAEAACKRAFCACLVEGSDRKCEPLTPKDTGVKITAPATGVPFSNGEVNLEYKEGEIILS
jgi:hypothetical protein